VGVDLESSDRKTRFRATGSVILFDGFLKLYQEGRDDTPDENADERILPAMEEGEAHDLVEVAREQHFTKPPPRYSEASLVKKLEELGIGRPSTYASIIDVLQARNYVHLERKRFIPEDRGRIVTAFLENFFQRYVQYTFTADLENQLDDISGGLIDWKKVLENFWSTFTQAVEDASGYTVRQVIDALDEELGPHFFPEKADGTDSRVCLSCTDGHLGLKLSKTGGFIGCSNYPDCTYTRSLAVGNGGEGGAESGPRNLGADEQSGQEISLRKGPYGFYVQLGEGEKDKKPKRKSLPRTLSPDSVDLAAAQALLALPRTVGAHPESGKTITADIGPYGPYLKHDGAYTSLKGDDDDVLTVGINRAVDLISRSRKGEGGSGRELGAHPDDGKPVFLKTGRYGPYASHGRINASLPKDTSSDAITLEEAVSLLAANGKPAGSGRKKKAVKSKKSTKAKSKSSTAG
jgi:DNA topoisomerase-1